MPGFVYVDLVFMWVMMDVERGLCVRCVCGVGAHEGQLAYVE